MSVGAISRSSNIEYGGFYFPSAVFGYLWITDGGSVAIWPPSLLHAFTFSLIGGVLVHGVFRSIFGPRQVRIKPISRTELIRTLKYVMVGKKRPVFYDDGILINIQVGARRLIFLICLVTSMGFLIISYPLTVLIGFSRIASGDLILGVLVFVQIAWMLRILTFPYWSSVYTLRSSRERPAIETDIEEFHMYLRRSTNIGQFGSEYVSEEEPHIRFRYETIAESSEDEEIAFRDVIDAFAGTVATSDYPCHWLEATIVENGDEVGKYVIPTNVAVAYADGEVTYSDVLTAVITQIESKRQPSVPPAETTPSAT